MKLSTAHEVFRIHRWYLPNQYQREKETRSDQFAHWPEFSEKRGRCKFPDCKGIFQTQCSKRETYLCFTKDRNCFKNFH